MNKTEILVVANMDVARQAAMEQAGANPAWNVVGASGIEAAIERFHSHQPDLIVYTDLSLEDEKKLKAVLRHQDDALVFIHHRDGSNELEKEISAALEKRWHENKATVSIVDDALVNAGLKLTIQ